MIFVKEPKECALRCYLKHFQIASLGNSSNQQVYGIEDHMLAILNNQDLIAICHPPVLTPALTEIISLYLSGPWCIQVCFGLVFSMYESESFLIFKFWPKGFISIKTMMHKYTIQ